MKTWRGRAFTAEELKAFDVERVLGAPCVLVISHEERDGTVYGNVTAIMKAGKKDVIKPSGTYVRVKDRTDQKAAPTAGAVEDDEDDNDLSNGQTMPDIPF